MQKGPAQRPRGQRSTWRESVSHRLPLAHRLFHIATMFIEVDSNPNCEQSLFMRFKEVGPARAVRKVRSDERRSEGEWCWVIGWTDDEARPTCPAQAQPIEDSGAGLSTVVYGGIHGIRLKPVALDEDWDLESPNQWGEPYLVMADPRDIEFEESEE